MISNKKTYVFDIDGTLCEIKPDNKEYSEVTPIQGMIDRLNLLYTDGCYIILFTSRGMRTYNGNLKDINKFVKPTLVEWLDKYNVQYDELIMGKPWGHDVIYVDDKSQTPFTFMLKELNGQNK